MRPKARKLQVVLSSNGSVVVPQPVKLYLRHLANNGKSEGTRARYREALVYFFGYFDQRDPSEITTDMLDEFFEDTRSCRSAPTVNVIKSAIRGFYKHLLLTDKITKDPTRLISNEKVVRKTPRIFSDEELLRFLATIEKKIGSPPAPRPLRDWTMFMLAYNTGLRVSELVAVNVDDVEGKTVLEVVGKGKKLARLPLSQLAQAAMRRYLRWRRHAPSKDRDALFLNRSGRRIGTTAVERRFRAWLGAAEVKGKFSPHTLRHAFGTHTLRATKNIRTVQNLLRHAQLATSQIYLHVEPQEERTAVESLLKPEGSTNWVRFKKRSRK